MKKSIIYLKEHLFNINERASLDFNDTLGSFSFPCLWTSTIYSREGAWYHAFFPKNSTKEQLKTLKNDFKYYASHQGDPVKFTYSFIEDEIK